MIFLSRLNGLITGFFLIIMLTSASCLDPSGNSGSSGGAIVTSTATAIDGSSDGELQDTNTSGVGTVVYLPEKPKTLTQTLVFKSSELPEIDSPDVGLSAPVEDPESPDNSEISVQNESLAEYCRKVESADKTQSFTECRVTPQSFSMGIKAVYLVRCENASGTAVSCGETGAVSVAKIPLYEGDMVPLTVTQDGVEFPQPIGALSADFAAGGIQLVYGFLEQKWHDNSTNADQAAKITEALQGVAYRRCTMMRRIAGDALIAADCGHAEAEFGDYLFDVNRDGLMGYLDRAAIESGEVLETPNRADFFQEDAPRNFFGIYGMKDFLGVENEISESGYFAPTYRLKEVKNLSSTESYRFTMDFNITSIMHFIDGFSKNFENLEVGIYHPTEDKLPFMKAPKASVTIEVAP